MESIAEPELDAISLKVEGIESEFEIDPHQCQLDILLNKKLIQTVPFNETTIVSLPPSSPSLQLMVRSSSRPLGSVGFKLPELLELNHNVERKHWITLFDDEDDNLYDGDYGEDDIDQPRILLLYQIIDNLLVLNLGRSTVGIERPSSTGDEHIFNKRDSIEHKDSSVLIRSKTQSELEENKESESSIIKPLKIDYDQYVVNSYNENPLLSDIEDGVITKVKVDEVSPRFPEPGNDEFSKLVRSTQNDFNDVKTLNEKILKLTTIIQELREGKIELLSNQSRSK